MYILFNHYKYVILFLLESEFDGSVTDVKEIRLRPSVTSYHINELQPGNKYRITLETMLNGKYSSPIVLHVTVPVPTITR